MRGSRDNGRSVNPGPSPLAPPPGAAHGCPGAATRWQQTLCDRAAGGSARRGRPGRRPGDPTRDATLEQGPLSRGPLPSVAGNRLLRGWPRTPCPVLGAPPRAAVPGRGRSRGGSADPLGGGPGRSTAIRPQGQRAPGTPRAEGRERALRPGGSQAGRSVLSGSGRGLSPLQTDSSRV